MSRAYSLAGTTFIAKKPFTQWDGLMKMYYKKHEVTCKVSETPVDVPLDLHAEMKLPTGSSYEGAINVLGMGGYGEYTFPNGVIYRGEIQDGRFHGFGELVYKDGPEAESIIQGHWIKGVLTDQKILFNGKLQYEANNWMYCLVPDRRYALEYDTGLRPAGQSLITAEEPMRPIPPGYYDTGDGFYNPKTKMVYDYEHKVVKRSPSHRERKWIIDNCRKEPIETLGPRQDLYEKWVEPIVNPLTDPEPLVSYRGAESRDLSVSESETFYSSMQMSNAVQSEGIQTSARRKMQVQKENQHHVISRVFDQKLLNLLIGVIYEGEFNDGTMHGKGELRYKTTSGTATIKGLWKNGIMVEKTVIFDDVLEYDEHDWKYCQMPDRRFSIEYQKGLLPAGKSLQTAPQPTIKVPVGYYDTDDGFYDIKRKVVYEHDDLTKIVRGPSCRERKWIQENCRLGAERMNFGPRPDLYERFVEPTMLLEPNQPSEYYTRFKLNSELSDTAA